MIPNLCKMITQAERQRGGPVQEGFEHVVKLHQWHWEHEPPYQQFDPECIELCRAINVLPGIRTSESCCGHARKPFRIWLHFDANDLRGLVLLTRAIDHRYSGGPCWRLELSISDVSLPDNLAYPISICLSSPENVSGPQAYQEAHELADNIAISVNHENFLHGFGLNSLKGLLPIPATAPAWMLEDR